MLIAKCYDLRLYLKDGKTLRPKGALLHDPSGASWPRSSCLIASFKKADQPLTKPSKEAALWARKRDNVRRGKIETPPRAMSGWKKVGDVCAIDYTRHGEHADKYTHEFRRPVGLYRRGNALRLELGRGAVFNWRGFIAP